MSWRGKKWSFSPSGTSKGNYFSNIEQRGISWMVIRRLEIGDRHPKVRSLGSQQDLEKTPRAQERDSRMVREGWHHCWGGWTWYILSTLHIRFELSLALTETLSLCLWWLGWNLWSELQDLRKKSMDACMARKQSKRTSSGFKEQEP